MLIAALVALLPVQGAEEWVAIPTPGFVVGHRQVGRDQSIEERVPEGETVQDWTRMITVLGFRNNESALSMANVMGQYWTRSCPGGTSNKPTGGQQDGRLSLTARLDCPRNPRTGKPETMFLRVFRSETTAYLVQVAFRSLPSGSEVEWAERQLADATLCTAASYTAACRR